MDDQQCAQCGTPASSGAKFCKSCGAPLAAKEAQPTQEPHAHTQPEVMAPSGAPAGAPAYELPAQMPRLRYQSVGIRLLPQLFDDLVVGAIIFAIIALLFGGTAAITAPRNLSGAIGVALTASAVVVGVLVWFFYFTLLEGQYGQTLGKWLGKIKVVKEDTGAPITYRDAAVRTILRIIDGLFSYLVGAILIWTSEERQRLGDRLAHTVVIQLCDGTTVKR